MIVNYKDVDDRFLAKVGEWIGDINGNFENRYIRLIHSAKDTKMFISIEEEEGAIATVRLLRVFSVLGSDKIEISQDAEVVVKEDNLLNAISSLLITAMSVTR